ncbi:MAG TPA: hypothetical protein VNC19_04050, partial [Gemmatimonadales bacterium]|nr:hypothetical protein [Gemmatimonadales bacterium]
MRPLLLAAVLAGMLAPAWADAQASPYIPLDDSRLPLLEHLITRGEIEDPSPMIRPFRRADAIEALAAADTLGNSSTARLIRKLRGDFADSAGNSWAVEGRAGGQAYTHARRDLLHAAGPKGVRLYAELGGWATFGNIVLVTRPVAEPRLTVDPDWQ